MRQVIVIADDFTGACDTALQFVRAGLRSEVCTIPPGASGFERDADVPVLVFGTETRGLPARDAADRVRDLCRRIRDVTPALIYKKVDSTLRGNVGPELRAALEVLDAPLCLFAPAFPGMGRITVGGYHLVGGVPLARSEFGRDPSAPVTRSFLPDLLEGFNRAAVGLIDLETVSAGLEAVTEAIEALRRKRRVVVAFDAASDEDMKVIARAAASVSPVPFLCGSAGLAGHLPEAFGLRGDGTIPRPIAGRGPVLVVAGSSSTVTRDQVARLCERSHTHLHAEPFEALARGSEASLSQVEDSLVSHLRDEGCDAVVVAVKDVPGSVSPDEGEAALSALGRMVRRVLAGIPVSGLILTGGWTAFHVVRALGAKGAEVCAEVEPGIPLCRLKGGPFDGMGVVTKAGGFGTDEALVRGVATFEKPNPHPPPVPLPLPYTGEGGGISRLPPATGEGEGLPLLAITMGDVCGIGPEVIARALAFEEVYHVCRPLVIGHRASLEAAIGLSGRTLGIRPVSSPAEGRYRFGTVDLLDPGDLDLSETRTGKICPQAGRAAVVYALRAADLAMTGEVDGVVTAPLNKAAMKLAGFSYAGHTELFTERTGAGTSRMMLATDSFRIVHVTTHIALRDVPGKVTADRIVATLEMAHEALIDLGIERPRIVVSGLNPHCGEGGMFGDEDGRVVSPAVGRAKARGWEVTGPLPPDTVFQRAYRGEFDAVIAMYHDQGHIPMKLVAFAEAVNVTLGLPIVRTSVDHGTAFDIAGRGVADPANMLAAIRLGARLAKSRKSRNRR